MIEVNKNIFLFNEEVNASLKGIIKKNLVSHLHITSVALYLI